MDFSREKEGIIYLAGGFLWGAEPLMSSMNIHERSYLTNFRLCVIIQEVVSFFARAYNFAVFQLKD